MRRNSEFGINCCRSYPFGGLVSSDILHQHLGHFKYSFYWNDTTKEFHLHHKWGTLTHVSLALIYLFCLILVQRILFFNRIRWGANKQPTKHGNNQSNQHHNWNIIIRIHNLSSRFPITKKQITIIVHHTLNQSFILLPLKDNLFCIKLTVEMGLGIVLLLLCLSSGEDCLSDFELRLNLSFCNNFRQIILQRSTSHDWRIERATQLPDWVATKTINFNTMRPPPRPSSPREWTQLYVLTYSEPM